jgi:hypothetical protein
LAKQERGPIKQILTRAELRKTLMLEAAPGLLNR